MAIKAAWVVYATTKDTVSDVQQTEKPGLDGFKDDPSGIKAPISGHYMPSSN